MLASRVSGAMLPKAHLHASLRAASMLRGVASPRSLAPQRPFAAADIPRPSSPSFLAGAAAARRLLASRAGDVAAKGDFVTVHYTGTLDDGEQFDSSRDEGREPLSFVVGAGTVIAGFDLAVTGLAEGESRKQRIEPDMAYGEWREEMTAKVPLANAPEGLVVGSVVELQNGMTATVTAVTNEHVEIDANQRLAGKALTFDLELLRLVKAGGMQRATFGAGCFWSVELAFQRVPGVVDTRVGYCQGESDTVTYEEVCGGNTGHNEVVQVAYDPSLVSYEALLDAFWAKHDPTTPNRSGNDVGPQYRSGIYYHTEEQRALAQASLDRQNAKLGGSVVTELEELRNWVEAEDYHQQYLAKGGRFGQPQSTAKGCTDPIRCYG